ncbi:hypothetical protein C8J57DRAFT_1223553 [Mycena rebaudengoi]|nr:hypothetical protein C8J57DRAFT_1223553 [Mycena rebaudengoi]
MSFHIRHKTHDGSEGGSKLKCGAELSQFVTQERFKDSGLTIVRIVVVLPSAGNLDRLRSRNDRRNKVGQMQWHVHRHRLLVMTLHGPFSLLGVGNIRPLLQYSLPPLKCDAKRYAEVDRAASGNENSRKGLGRYKVNVQYPVPHVLYESILTGNKQLEMKGVQHGQRMYTKHVYVKNPIASFLSKHPIRQEVQLHPVLGAGKIEWTGVLGWKLNVHARVSIAACPSAAVADAGLQIRTL